MDALSVLAGLVSGIVLSFVFYIVVLMPDELGELDSEEARKAMTRLEEIFQRRER